jgi:hypothetical protein
MSRRALTSRADLLRALAHGVSTSFALDDGEAGWLGYRMRDVQRVAPSPAPPVPPQPPKALVPSKEPTVELGQRKPLQMDTIWAVVERSAVPMPASTRPSDAAIGALEPISEEEAGPPLSAQRLVSFEDLVPWARLTPVLRRRLAQVRSGGVDIARLCQAVAGQDPLRRLPRRHTTRWHPEIVVALDFSARLWPYRWDMHRLCEQLRRQCGRTGLSLRVMLHGPPGGWSEWRTDDDAVLPLVQGWTPPPVGARLLIVGDLGALAPDPVVSAQWQQLVAQAQAAGVHVEALLPLGVAQLPADISARLPLIRWSPDSHLRHEPVAMATVDGDGPALEADADFLCLMTMVACLRRVDGPLLRALRRLLPHRHGDAGLEGAVWNHPDVLAGMACELKPLVAERWLARFADLPTELQRKHRQLAAFHHGHLRAALNHEEVLLHSASAADGVAEAVAVSCASNFMIRVARTVQESSDPALQARWHGFVQDAVRRVDAHTARVQADVYSHLLAADLRRRPVQAQNNLPAWADGQRVLDLLEPQVPMSREYWIVEDGVRERIQLQPTPPDRGQRALQAKLDVDRILVRSEGTGVQQVVVLRGQTVPLCATSDRQPIELASAAHRWLIAPVRRPLGVESWSLPRTTDDVAAPDIWCTAFSGAMLNIGGLPLFQAPRAEDRDGRYHIVTHDWMRWAGLKAGGYGLDRHGLYFDMVVDAATMRLRYMPPGQFLMGSPEGVGHDDERPQHPVTLTEGYWLADTPCPQALWQAVMGDNPSQFKDGPDAADRPVENVSWDDVQGFLQRLRQLLPPGCEPTLPTEAQWEYAARAGSSTTYWWGDEPDDARANWRAQHQGTTPVRRFAANPWGLHDVHGNVFEWCLDDRRDYAPDPVRDPHGDLESSVRALRGGSWYDAPGGARSACRSGWRRGGANPYQGFRLSLRSPSPGAGGPGQGGGTGGPATGAGRPGAAGALPRPKGAPRNKKTAAKARKRK